MKLPRWFKRALIALLIIFILAGTALTLFVKHASDDYLKELILKKANKAFAGKYELDIGGLQFDFKQNEIKVHEIKVTSLCPKKVNEKIDSLSVYVPYAEIHNFDILRFWVSKNYKADTVLINKPHIFISQADTSKKEFTDKRKKPRIKLDIAYCKTDSAFFYFVGNTKDTLVHSETINLWASNFSLLRKANSNKIELNYKILDFNGGNTQIKIPAKAYDIQLERYKGNTHDSLLTATKLHLKGGDKHKAGKLEIKVKQADFKGINLDLLLRNREISCKNSSLDKLQFHLDAIKTAPGSAPKEWLLDKLRKVKVKMDFEDIVLSNSYFLYYETAHTGKGTKIMFNKVYAQIKNFTNKEEIIALQPKMKIHTNAYFFGKSQLKASGEFYLNNPHLKHTLKGSIGSLDLKQFNTFMEDQVNMKILDGYLSKLDFALSANRYSISGNTTMIYKDLNLRIYKKHNPNEDKKLLSYVANRIVKTNNPMRKKDPREGVCNYNREPHQSMFALWSKGLLSGIISSIGPVKAEKMARFNILQNKKIFKRKRK